MNPTLSRRDVLKTMAAAGCLAALPEAAPAGLPRVERNNGWVSGHMTGAQALVETLQLEGTECVFGIPGAQNNELWDTMKSKRLPYLLATHEFSAACMADGYARSTGKAGVLCVVPGPGLTNSLTGIGEARLDSVPLVVISTDVARGDKYKPFQVHELPQLGLVEQLAKGVFPASHAAEIPDAVRQAFQLAQSGEPGPAAVVIPYPLFIAQHRYHSAPLAPTALPFDESAFQRALSCLSNRKLHVGIYAGLGCMDFSEDLTRVAELLQAPVATSVSGKGTISECHPLAVGWGYGPQGTSTAEQTFKHVDLVLAIGVRFSEVSTAFYSIPKKSVIHVDANADNLGQVVKTAMCVHADAGVFLARLLAEADAIQRPPNSKLVSSIAALKKEECKKNAEVHSKCGVDPMALVLSLRRLTRPDALMFVDAMQAEHWAAEAFTVYQPRTYFNSTNNQAMGWSVPAALGAQRAQTGRQTVALLGDGCFLMTAMEISTAGRECLPVKFFVLDDQAYHYMQTLQKSGYRRTTATILARLDYRALAQGFGVAYNEIGSNAELETGVQNALLQDGPVLTRVVTDYGKRPCRWIDAVKDRYKSELTREQKIRFMARIGSRSLHLHQEND